MNGLTRSLGYREGVLWKYKHDSSRFKRLISYLFVFRFTRNNDTKAIVNR